MHPDEIRGPLSFIGSLAVSPIEQHQRLPPPQKTLANVSLAAHLCGWCGYLAPLAVEFSPSAPLQASMDEWIPLGVCAFVTLIAVLWLLAAMKAAQAPRNPGAALWRLLLGGAIAWLLWRGVYLPAHFGDWVPIANVLLKGIYIGWLASHVARFLVAAQLIGGGNALRTINREIRRRNAPLRPVRPRRFFIW